MNRLRACPVAAVVLLAWVGAAPLPAQTLASAPEAGIRVPTPLALELHGNTARLVFDESLLDLDEDEADELVRALHAPGSFVEAYGKQQLFLRRADGTVVPWAELQRIPTAARAIIDAGRERNMETRGGSPPPVGSHVRSGALAGRRIVVSPGHGYDYSATLGGWTTQRGEVNGIVEDISNNELAGWYLIPYLERAGAVVLSARERGVTETETVIDDGDAGYSEDGAWSDGSAPGYGGTYRTAAVDATGSAVAHFRFTVPADDTYPVYARWIAGTNRAVDATFEVVHAGGTTPVPVSQQAEDARWIYLGGFFFLAGTAYEVRLSSRGADPSQVVVADAVRVGGGMGDVVNGGMTSGQARWRESAWAWVHFIGATIPDAVLSCGDVTIRPTYADWEGADAYLSLHSNAGGGTGTESYIHDTAPSAGSAALMAAVHGDLVHAIRTLWDPAWVDRGQKTANFGELRECRSMPAVLVETAFHDLAEPDAAFLIHPRFRHDIGRAMAYGIQEYLAPGTLPLPLPPEHLRVRALDGRRARVQWTPAADPAWPAAVPAGYRVYLSADGRGFDDTRPLETAETSLELAGLPWGETTYLRVTAVNAGGESFPTEVLGVRPLDPPSRILVVNGFDRLDRYVRETDNTFDFVVEHGEAIAAAGDGRYGFDSTSNEAVAAGEVELGGYGTVLWILGEESTQDDSFGTEERAAVDAYLAGGGNLGVSESEMGWDLVERGTAEETAWLTATFHATYVADDAGSYAADATAGGLFDGLGTVAFDDGTHGTYDTNYPDVYAAVAPATADLAYAGGAGGAAIVFDGTNRTVLLGFGFEGIYDQDQRRDVMTRILGFLAPDVPLPVEPADGGDGDADGDADAGGDGAADDGGGVCDRCREECACRATGVGGGSTLGVLGLGALGLLLRRRRRST
jgi:MYXO-CTERM domain-containing protein